MPEFLIVGWDRQHVSAVQAETRGTGVRLIGGWTGAFPEGMVPAQNPKAAGEWLRGQWSTAGLTAKSVWLMIPREDVILRHLELPNVADAELPDLVRFQTSARSAVSLDQVHLDFLPLSPTASRPGRDVLAVTLPRSVTTMLTTVLAAADRDLAGVSLSSSALAAWCTAIAHQRHPREETTLAVAFGPGRVELAIVEQGRLNYAHAARLFVDEAHSDPHAATLSEISRTLVAAGRLRPELKLDRVWLIGSDDAFAKALTERVECPVECVDPTERLAEWVVPDALKPLAADRALLYGQATLIGHAAPCAVDFLHPRQPPPIRDPRKLQYAVWSAAALAALFLIGGISMIWIASLDRHIAALQKKQGELNEYIRVGKPALEQAGIVGTWEDRNIDQLAQLAELEKLMPGGYERPYFMDYLYQVTTGGDVLGRLSANGAAKTETHISEFKTNISDRPYFVSLPKPVLTSRDDQYPKYMSIDVQRRIARATPKPAAPAKPAAKAAATSDKPTADKPAATK